MSRGNALCYFERAAEGASELGGQTLQGLIDLREVLRAMNLKTCAPPAP